MELIIGNKLVLCDQETPDKIPEHYVDEEFYAQSEYRIHSGQFLTIPDSIWDSMCELVRQPNAIQLPRDTDTLLWHRFGAEFSGGLVSEIRKAQTGNFFSQF